MYAPISLNDFSHDSQNSARLILGFRDTYVGIKELLGKFTASCMAYLFAIPIILITRYLRYRIEHSVPKYLEFDIKDENDYARFRKGLDESISMVAQLKPILSIDASDAPFIVSILVKQIQKVIVAMDNVIDRIAQALSVFEVNEKSEEFNQFLIEMAKNSFEDQNNNRTFGRKKLLSLLD